MPHISASFPTRSTRRAMRALSFAGAAVLLQASSALAQTAAPPPTPVAFEAALTKAANDLFSKVNLEGAPAKVRLVIDPLIDGFSGAQSTATRTMEKRIVDLVRRDYSRFEVTPFTTEAIANLPVVLIGTFTAINNGGVAGGERDAYRICLALADLKAKKIISKGVARALPEGIDVTPVAFFAESPVFVKDAAIESYIKSCQGTRPGDSIDPVYADRILAAALINDATEAYNAKRYQDSLELYRSASHMPGGEQLRVLNGLYLSNWRLNRKDAAAEAFGKVVDYGLRGDNLAVKFLFRPGSTQFMADQGTRRQYTMWTSQIAGRADKADKCLQVVGHTSATGTAAINETLSAQRAEYVKARLQKELPRTNARQRFTATGVGSQQLIIGTGRDDASDALDRRVEFKTVTCAEPSAAQPTVGNRQVVNTVAAKPKPKREARRTGRGASSDVGAEIEEFINSSAFKSLLE